MIALIFYYLVLPFLLFGAIHWFLKRFGSQEAAREVQELYHGDPIAAKHYRAVRLNGKLGQPGASLLKIGDFEKQDEAVDAAFEARTAARKEPGSSYLVLNDRGEVLQDV